MKERHNLHVGPLVYSHQLGSIHSEHSEIPKVNVLMGLVTVLLRHDDP